MIRFNYTKILKTFNKSRKKLLHFIMNKNKTVEEKLYEAIGVRCFQKGVMYCVRKILKLSKKPVDNAMPKVYSNYTIKCKGRPYYFLPKFKKWLWYNGIFHIIGIDIGASHFMNGMNLNDTKTMIYGGGFLVINAYCLMLQRYNYIRLNKAIKVAKEHDKIQTPKNILKRIRNAIDLYVDEQITEALKRGYP